MSLTDFQRLNILDEYIHRKTNNMFEIEGKSMFTIPTQHARVENIREAIDVLNYYLTGKRCWSCENPFIIGNSKFRHRCFEHKINICFNSEVMVYSTKDNI